MILWGIVDGHPILTVPGLEKTNYGITFGNTAYASDTRNLSSW